MAMVKKPPVGAHYGLRDWLAQRLTAAALVVSFVVFTVALLACQPSDYESWMAFTDSVWVRVSLFSTVLALAWHAYIGARDIFMDYIKHDMFRLVKISGAFAYLFMCVAWAAHILL